MAEKYREKPPVYEAVQVTRQNGAEVTSLLRKHYIRAEESWWRDHFSMDVTVEDGERGLFRDFRYRPQGVKPSLPLTLEEDTWIVVSRNGIQIHSATSFEERFELDA